ncbi:MAG: response regulator [Vicinamibacteria bacterium]|nr:response regulator [Vicinamibacteria bacterium]
MDRDRQLQARLMATFRVEALEHLQALNANLQALDRDPAGGQAPALLEATFRAMHTLKGAARSVSQGEVEALCHASESLLSNLKRGQLPLTRSALDRLLEAVDGLTRLLSGAAGERVDEPAHRLERQATAPATSSPEAPSDAGPAPLAAIALPQVSAVRDSLRVATTRLEALTLRSEELLAAKLAAAERAREVLALADGLEACRATLGRAPAGVGATADRLQGGTIESALHAAAAQARELQARLARDARATAVGVDGLSEEVRRLRMTPAASVLDVFPPMVRGLAREQGKEIEWVAQGAEHEVDSRVLEVLKDPLIHLVRNAIDHGIEPPSVRASAGKAARGRVTVAIAPLEGGQLEIRVDDDGGGIDPRRVREAAVRGGLLAATSGDLADEAAADLACWSGLSTSPIITEVSGHGLGLAIVKERVEGLRGRLLLESRAGHGLTVRMLVPASIATFRGLLVRCGLQAFLLPIESVERVMRVAPSQIEQVDGRDVVRAGGGLGAEPPPSGGVSPHGTSAGVPPALERDGQPLFVARLADLLQTDAAEAPPEPEGQRPCAVVRSERGRLGLIVDEILGDREVLQRELCPPLRRVRSVAGAGLLGSGQLVLTLRPSDLLRGAARRNLAVPPTRPAGASRPAPKRRASRVLVVDDSITTRTMERHLLEAAGYEVVVAVDGIDAWTPLKTGPIDLVVSDVDMPRMDGFGLTARIRADPELAALPVVLVTALESREDKERGIEVGANAYVVKSSFDQSNLLDIIRRLV